jgi:hypothetical protein
MPVPHAIPPTPDCNSDSTGAGQPRRIWVDVFKRHSIQNMLEISGNIRKINDLHKLILNFGQLGENRE